MAFRWRWGCVLLVGMVWADSDISWWATLPCGNNLPTQPRIVINSHVHYKRPLNSALHSLVSVGFRDFCRLLIVVGGKREEAPSKLGNITVAARALNAHDTGFDTLHLYRTHPDIAAPYYIYVHDTCLFQPSFVPFFSKLPELLGSSSRTILSPRTHL